MEIILNVDKNRLPLSIGDEIRILYINKLSNDIAIELLDEFIIGKVVVVLDIMNGRNIDNNGVEVIAPIIQMRLEDIDENETLCKLLNYTVPSNIIRFLNFTYFLKHISYQHINRSSKFIKYLKDYLRNNKRISRSYINM